MAVSRFRAILPAWLGLLLLAAPAAAVPGTLERVVDLPLRDGGLERVLVSAPPHPWAAIVMLPGGAGDIGIRRDGSLRHGENFVVRTRAAWTARGYVTLVPDAIDRASLRGSRSSDAYARAVGQLVALAHRQTPGPVFLLGTSQGSIAAMNAAAHAPAGSVAGVVLTESVSVMGGSGETVFDAGPARVRVPALVVANRDDRCAVAPPDAARRIAAAMTASRAVRVLTLSGGVIRSRDDCGSLTPHGYFGIEDTVVAAIDRWMKARR